MYVCVLRAAAGAAATTLLRRVSVRHLVLLCACIWCLICGGFRYIETREETRVVTCALCAAQTLPISTLFVHTVMHAAHPALIEKDKHVRTHPAEKDVHAHLHWHSTQHVPSILLSCGISYSCTRSIRTLAALAHTSCARTPVLARNAQHARLHGRNTTLTLCVRQAHHIA